MAEDEARPLAWWTYVGVGVLWYASNAVLGAGGVEGETAYLLVAAAFVGTFGVACLVNGRRCGALHCRISGPGYLGVAGLAILGAVGVVPVGEALVFALFGAVFVGSYAVEFLAASSDAPEPVE